MKTFGKADEFYRARVITTSAEETAEFKWREDILYHSDEEDQAKLSNTYRIELVELDSNNKLILKSLQNLEQAKLMLATIQDDLAELTKNEFDLKYLEENTD
ncbi:MAG: hypothetical protein C4562_06600 [Actinobacteria bacterium]|nr:MAG: hypothetical protein C4562_06600 [Actinomycetota bacterium]